jgi:O-antigen ligase
MISPPSVLRYAPLDALKGVLLVVMSVNHLSSNFPGLKPWIAHFYWTFGIFSVALGFVFLSGITTSLSLSHFLNSKAPFRHAAKKLLLRIRKIYVVHIITATIAVISIVIMPPHSSSIGSFQRISSNPITSWFEIATFLYCPVLLDILPLYCYLFLATGAVLPMLRTSNSRWLLLIVSFVLWGVSRYWTPTLGPYNSNFLVFHPLAWQLLFVAGLLVGSAKKKDAATITDRSSTLKKLCESPHLPRALFCICLVISTFFFNQRHKIIPSLTVPWSSMSGIMGVRSTLSPGSLINLGALSYTLWWIYSRVTFTWGPFRALVHLFASVGRHSLEVFAWNISLNYILIGMGFDAGKLSYLQQGLILATLVASGCLPLLMYRIGKYLLSKVHTGGFELLLCSMVALIPIAYVPNFGVPYREIKNVLLWGSAAGIALLSTRRLTQPLDRPLELPLVALLYSAYGIIGFQLLSLLYSQNVGEGLVQIFTVISAVVLMWSAARSSLTVERVAVWLLFPTLVTIALVFYRTYFGGILTPAGAGLGGLVGERNSSAILLAQIIPLLLIFSARTPLSSGLQSPLRQMTIRYLTALLIAASVLASVLPRSRTAWGMLALIFFASLYLYIRTLSRIWKAYCMTTVCGIVCTVLLITALPTTLRWSSPTPYITSLSSLSNPIKNSNGRDQLWRVGGEMLQSHPLRGVGAGQYPVVMKEHLVSSGATPHTFAFLRRDLPLLNDYLQAGVELGYVGGCLYILFFLGTPIWLLWQQVRKGAEKNGPLILASLSSLSIALAGFVDYPFHRAENVTLFSILVGISLKGATKVTSEDYSFTSSRLKPVLRRSLMFLIGIFLVIGTISFGLSFGLRSVGYKSGSVRPLALSWNLWPWDSSWDEKYGEILRREKDEHGLTDYLSKRLSYWPFASTTWITIAESAGANGAHSVAANAYIRALFEVPGGRCNYRAKVYLERYLRTHSLPPEHRESLQNEIKKCPPY